MQRLHFEDANFARDFDRLVNARREADPGISRDVSAIITDVKTRGDAALIELTDRLDGHDLAPDGWSIDKATCAAAFNALEPDLRIALELAASRIRHYHQTQLPLNRDAVDDAGVRLGARWGAVDSAGLYVPGGRAAYPSSLLMNAIPAKVAGVGRLVVVTPTPKGTVNPLVLAAAHVAGVDEIWRLGGAQAIAALTYGTEHINAVDVITGPGNAYVAEAKRQVFGTVGIDMVAGPSEIVVVSDANSNAEWIAADLLSQSEHDPSSQSILITDDAQFADSVADFVSVQLTQLSTQKVAAQAWDENGAIIIVESLDKAIPLVNRLAAEHVELAVDDPDALFAQIRHAGSVFLGRMTPEAIGDYVAGPNHVLPTGRRARFSSGLSVLDFMKRTSFIALDEAALGAIGPAAVALATMEGLPAHAASVQKRLDDNG